MTTKEYDNDNNNLIYKVAFGIASFLLIFLIGYFMQTMVYLQKFGFENRERIVKIEQCQENIETNQKLMIEAQKEILVNINELNKSLYTKLATEKRT